MSAFKRTLLAVQSVLVLGMIVLDPEEAHRPPPVRDEVEVASIVAEAA